MQDLSFIARLHPALVHYPIAFLTYGLGLEIYSAATGRRIGPFAQWTLALGVLACLPSVVTGWFAASPVVDDHQAAAKLVPLHNIAAYATFFGAIMYTGLRFGEIRGEWRSPTSLRVVLGVLLLICLVATGFTGGKLTRSNSGSPAAAEPSTHR